MNRLSDTPKMSYSDCSMTNSRNVHKHSDSVSTYLYEFLSRFYDESDFDFHDNVMDHAELLIDQALEVLPSDCTQGDVMQKCMQLTF